MMLKLRAIHKKLLRKLDTGEYAYHHTNFYQFESSKTMYWDSIVNELIEAGYVTRDDWEGEERLITTGKEWREAVS